MSDQLPAGHPCRACLHYIPGSTVHNPCTGEDMELYLHCERGRQEIYEGRSCNDRDVGAA